MSGKKSQKQAEELLWETRHSYKDTVIRTVDAGAARMTGNMLFADYMVDWLGHSNFSTTANIYAHLDTSSKNTSATRMNESFSISPGIRPDL